MERLGFRQAARAATEARTAFVNTAQSDPAVERVAEAVTRQRENLTDEQREELLARHESLVRHETKGEREWQMN